MLSEPLKFGGAGGGNLPPTVGDEVPPLFT